MQIHAPYLLFLGDAPDRLAAKVAIGINDWRPEKCLGQLRLEGCQADTGLPDMTVAEAVAQGARTVVVGVANRGGVISESWTDALVEALEAGMDLAAGLHQRLADVPALAEAAEQKERRLFDARHAQGKYEVGNGAQRSGHRLLTVGTDCSCGKMYASLAIDRELRQRGISSDFRATGQTGILIAGSGAPIDAVVADFISGAVEAISPAADADHWDVIEGQGSLYHPSFAGVTTGLIHGAQAEAMVLCHEPTRTHMRGLPNYSLPGLEECMEACLKAGRLTRPDVRFVGVAVNTSALDEEAAEKCLEEIGGQIGLPTVDPIRTGVAAIVDNMVGPGEPPAPDANE